MLNGVFRTPIYMLGVGFAFMVIALAFLALRVIRGIGDFQLTHYHFNYSDEFLRRGFVGEMLRLTGFPLTNFNISVLYAAAVVIFLLLLIVACVRIFADQPKQAGFLFMAFMLACPGLTLHYAYSSYGYLDIFQLLLAAFGLWAIFHCNRYMAGLIVLGFSVVSILIHESGLIITAPVLITALILKFPSRLPPVRATAFFVVLLAFTIGVWRFGSADVLSFEEHIAALQAQAGNPDYISDAAVLVLHRTLGDNVGLVLPRSVWWYLWQQVKFVIFAAPYLIVFVATLRAAQHFLKPQFGTLGASTLAIAVFLPVSLYPIGHDYFRWWSAAMTNYFMLTLFLAALQKGYLERLSEIIVQKRVLVTLGVVIGVTMGGIGGLLSFSVHTAPAAIAWRILF